MDLFSCRCPACYVAPPASLGGINTYYEYRGSFSLAKIARGVRFLIAAHSNYALYLDGKLMGFGQFADYAEAPVYDTLSLPDLDAGTHEVRITVYHVGTDTSTNRNRPTSLICQCIDGWDNTLFYSSPESLTVRLHPAYHSGDMERVSGQLGFTFSYDATKEEEAIPFVPTEDAGNTPRPQPRPIEKLTVGENMSASLLARGYFKAADRNQPIAWQVNHADLTAKAEEADGIWLRYDLGQETTGILSLDLTLPQACTVRIGWGEHLSDGRVRAYIGGRNFACRYVAKAGRNVFLNPFLRLGLRYLEVQIESKEAEIGYIGIRETLYPLAKRAAFRCDSQIHNKIYDVSIRTLHLCMHEHYEDCPWREQALYAMDSRNQMLCGYYAFGETRFARASLELMARSLRPDHLLELCSPARVSITIPSFSAMYLTQLWEYLVHSGDSDFVRRMLPVAIDIASGMISRLQNECGLMPVYPDPVHWNFYEWQSGLDGAIGSSVSAENMRYDAPMCAFLSLGLLNLSRILHQLGMEEDADQYESARFALNEAINTYFWNEEMGAYASFLSFKDHQLSHYAELTNALMVYARIAPPDRAARVCALLASEENTLLTVTLSHSIFKYEALLMQGGYHHFVFDRIRQVFSAMLDKDATTFWETDEGDSAFGNAGSLCHGWSAIPVYFYHRYALSPTEETGLSGCRLED